MIRIYVPDLAYKEKALALKASFDEGGFLEGVGACQLLFSQEDLLENERYLRLDAGGLTLVEGRLELRGDFRQLLPRVRGGHLQHEKLLRAARMKDLPEHPLAVDATAGLGEDAFILACGGYSVVLCEYNPVIAALLEDALCRARKDPDLTEAATRMSLVRGDGIENLKRLAGKPDLVYLDPMFPAKQKSGISKKKLQLLQKLELPCSREDELMAAALAAGPARIVVKRPVKGQPLAGKKASHSIVCKNVRFDCYVLPGRQTRGQEG